MKDRLTLVVVTPEKKLLEVETKSVRVLLADGGSMGILPGHAKLIAATLAGDLDYLDIQGNKSRIKLGSGILLVDNDLVQVMTNVLYEEYSEEDKEEDNLMDRITREIVEKLKVAPLDRHVSSNEE